MSLVLFTRVQNTGSHQMLLFVPGWLLLFLVGSAALADGLKKHTAVKPVSYTHLAALFKKLHTSRR